LPGLQRTPAWHSLILSRCSASRSYVAISNCAGRPLQTAAGMTSEVAAPPWYNGVVTYVPFDTCSRISPWEANPEGAASFDVASRSYWVVRDA
jgi:hypothetical protein